MTTATPTPSLFGQCLAGFLGTALLIFFGTDCVAALRAAGASFGLWRISIIWRVDVSMTIYFSAGVSGVHLNPAVSIAPQLFADLEGRKLPFYITAQVAGAFYAAALVYTLYNSPFTEFEQAQNIVRGSQDSLTLASVSSAYPYPAPSVNQVFLVEVVITAVLIAVVMALTDDGSGLPRSPLAPLLIGLLTTVIDSTMGLLASFATNPACDFGPKLVTYLAGWGPIAFTGDHETPYFLVPIFAPVLGVCLGTGGYRVLIARRLPSAAASTEAEPEKIRAF